jgi:hypothetical protein
VREKNEKHKSKIQRKLYVVWEPLHQGDLYHGTWKKMKQHGNELLSAVIRLKVRLVDQHVREQRSGISKEFLPCLPQTDSMFPVPNL